MVNLLTHAMTTVATVHEARCTEAIHAALAGRGLVPTEHLVDAAYVSVWFRETDCAACAARLLCTRTGQARQLRLQPRAEYEALTAARRRLATKEGRRAYARRAGIEGTLSQGVRAFGLRRARYRGLARTHLQHVATAAAINVERLTAWFRAVPRAATRTSRFAGLATA